MKQFIRSIYAGVCITIGGIAYLSADSKPLGAFLFSIGLLSVLIFNLDLYTGKVCSRDFLRRPVDLLRIWAGNALGASLTGFIMSVRGNILEAAQKAVEVKICNPRGIVLINAILCGICIALAVKGYQKAEGAGKYLAVVLGVMAFILSGAEHVIADIAYFAMARSFSIDGLIFLLIVTVGNTIGGALFSTLR